MELKGLHHVTAVSSRAQANVDFYTQVLGLRLVKKTVNQDDVSAVYKQDAAMRFVPPSVGCRRRLDLVV